MAFLIYTTHMAIFDIHFLEYKQEIQPPSPEVNEWNDKASPDTLSSTV